VQATSYAQARDALHRAGARLVFVGTGSGEQAGEYLFRYEQVAPFPAPLYLDASRESHKAFKLPSGIFRSIVPPIVFGVPRYGCGGACEGIALAYRNWNLAGSSWQQGGTFVLRKKREAGGEGMYDVVYGRPESHPADFAPMADVLEAAGVPADEIPEATRLAPGECLSRYLAKRAEVERAGGKKAAEVMECEGGQCELPPKVAQVPGQV